MPRGRRRDAAERRLEAVLSVAQNCRTLPWLRRINAIAVDGTLSERS
jgi:hypothetical protein